MCLFSVVYQSVPNCPILVFANREESPFRPCTLPHVIEGASRKAPWMGGQDLKAGGTWLGVNQAGLVVAVTNRPKSQTSPPLKSRGLLCRDLLEQKSLADAEAEFSRQWQQESFAGFNLMLISRERGVVISAGDELEIQPLQPGLHAVTNFDWNDPADRRLQRIRGLMEQFHHSKPTWQEWMCWGKSTCGLGEDAGGDAICYPCQREWGTVSSSVIALPEDFQSAHYFHAAGSPADTPYDDFSPQLVSLLDRAN